MPEFVWITIVLSLGLVAAAWFGAPREASRKPLIWMMVICGFASFGLMLSAVLMGHFVIMAGLMIVWAIFGRRPAVLRTFAILAPIVPYVWGVNQIVADRARLARMRTEYPVMSVAARLAYEHPSAMSKEAAAEFASTPFGPAVLMELVKQEERQSRPDYAQYPFKGLHDQTYDRFVGAMGFGHMRMAGMFRLPPDRQPPESIDQPEPDSTRKDDATPDARAALAGKPEALRPAGPSRSMLDYLHIEGAQQFVDVGRLGYIENRDHVVGFEPHRFDSLPKLDGSSGDDWRLARLELVSLLKHSEPRVYVSTHLPRMDELADAPTRPLDSFEAQSLPQLRTARDTVVDDGPNTVRMLGAVRAGKTCLQCHNVARGELLGAFSYVLRRNTPIAEPKSMPGPQQ